METKPTVMTGSAEMCVWNKDETEVKQQPADSDPPLQRLCINTIMLC